MKKLAFLMVLMLFSVNAFAGLPEMMKIYNNPSLAPKVKICKGDIFCNASVALSDQWKSIPNNYRYKGEFEIKSYAKSGITWDSQGRNIGLHSGFYICQDKSSVYLNSIPDKEPYIERIWAVLLYIEDKKGWTCN